MHAIHQTQPTNLRCGQGRLKCARRFGVHLRVPLWMLGNRHSVWQSLFTRLLGCWSVDCVVERAPVYEHPAAVDVSHVEIASVIECGRVRH